MADQLAPAAVRRRKSSVGAVEIQGPNGVVKTVNLEGLDEADRALAAEFGYKPVFKREFGYLSTFSFAVSQVDERLQSAIRLTLVSYDTGQHQWPLLDGRNDLLIPSVCRRQCLGSVVLADIGTRLYVHCSTYKSPKR